MRQKANGSFNESVLPGLSIPVDVARSRVPNASGLTIDPSVAFSVWTTVIVLKYLLMFEASRKSEWELITGKSHKYIASALGADNKDLVEMWNKEAESLINEFKKK